jgi:hypothetical protein
VFCGGEHGVADLFGGEHVLREKTTGKGQKWSKERVHDAVGGRFGLYAVERLDDAGPEDVNGFAGLAEQGVFGFSFDAGPHDAAAFGAVGAGSGDKDEGHSRIEADESLGGSDSDVVGDAGVVGFVHARGGNAEAEEASVEADEPVFDFGVVEQVLADDFRQLGMLRSGWGAAYGENAVDVGSEQAFSLDALSNHAGGAENQNVHDSYPMRQKAERFMAPPEILAVVEASCGRSFREKRKPATGGVRGHN